MDKLNQPNEDDFDEITRGAEKDLEALKEAKRALEEKARQTEEVMVEALRRFTGQIEVMEENLIRRTVKEDPADQWKGEAARKQEDVPCKIVSLHASLIKENDERREEVESILLKTLDTLPDEQFNAEMQMGYNRKGNLLVRVCVFPRPHFRKE